MNLKIINIWPSFTEWQNAINKYSNTPVLSTDSYIYNSFIATYGNRYAASNNIDKMNAMLAAVYTDNYNNYQLSLKLQELQLTDYLTQTTTKNINKNRLNEATTQVNVNTIENQDNNTTENNDENTINFEAAETIDTTSLKNTPNTTIDTDNVGTKDATIRSDAKNSTILNNRNINTVNTGNTNMAEKTDAEEIENEKLALIKDLNNIKEYITWFESLTPLQTFIKLINAALTLDYEPETYKNVNENYLNTANKPKQYFKDGYDVNRVNYLPEIIGGTIDYNDNGFYTININHGDAKFKDGTEIGTIDYTEDIKNKIDLNIKHISENANQINTNTGLISTNTGLISTNTKNITTNISNIATNKTNIATNITNIATNKTDISKNTQAIENIDQDFIKTIVAKNGNNDAILIDNKDPENLIITNKYIGINSKGVLIISKTGDETTSNIYIDDNGNFALNSMDGKLVARNKDGSPFIANTNDGLVVKSLLDTEINNLNTKIAGNTALINTKYDKDNAISSDTNNTLQLGSDNKLFVEAGAIPDTLKLNALYELDDNKGLIIGDSDTIQLSPNSITIANVHSGYSYGADFTAGEDITIGNWANSTMALYSGFIITTQGAIKLMPQPGHQVILENSDGSDYVPEDPSTPVTKAYVDKNKNSTYVNTGVTLGTEFTPDVTLKDNFVVIRIGAITANNSSAWSSGLFVISATGTYSDLIHDTSGTGNNSFVLNVTLTADNTVTVFADGYTGNCLMIATVYNIL